MKIVTLTLAAFAASVTIASAETTNNISNLIQEQHRGGQGGHVAFDAVTAVGDGSLEIYDFHLGEIGRKLGSTDVSTGANSHVHVNILNHHRRDIIALLKVNGQVVDTQELRLHNR